MEVCEKTCVWVNMIKKRKNDQAWEVEGEGEFNILNIKLGRLTLRVNLINKY